MFTTQHEEVLSFVSKMTFLSGCGINASLNLNSMHGNLYISFNVDLGKVQQPQNVPPRYPCDASSHCKPSQIRRRKRRRKAQAGTRKSSKVSSSDQDQLLEVSTDVLAPCVSDNLLMTENKMIPLDNETGLIDNEQLCIDLCEPMLLQEVVREEALDDETLDDSLSNYDLLCSSNLSSPSSGQTPNQRNRNVYEIDDASAKYWDQMSMMLQYLVAKSNQS